MRRSVILLLICVLTGCLGDPGPKRYRVSGEITFDGKPVPHGEIVFTPDSGKGNSGPQGIAIIQDGLFDTKGTRAPGVAGGATVVQVAALADANGKLLCEYQLNLDLPKADSTHKIEIPASATKKKTTGPEI